MDISVQQSRTSTKKWSKIMKFANLVEKCGFIMAVRLQQNMLSQDKHFIDGLTFQTCIVILSNPDILNEQLKELVFRRLSICPSSVDDWFKIYSSRLSDPKLKELALRNMDKGNQTLAGWLKIYKSHDIDDQLKELVFRQLSNYKASFDEWLEIYKNYTSDDQLNELAFKMMRELANQDD